MDENGKIRSPKIGIPPLRLTRLKRHTEAPVKPPAAIRLFIQLVELDVMEFHRRIDLRSSVVPSIAR